MWTQDRPTSLPAPKGVIISWSSSLTADRFKDDAGCPVEAIALDNQIPNFFYQILILPAQTHTHRANAQKLISQIYSYNKASRK